MNGSSSTVSPFDSGTKKRFSPTPSASAIFSSVPRLGVIWPLSMRERYERETRERACSWLCVMPRDSRNWRIRWPIFSTVSRLGHFSKACRSSPGISCDTGGGIRNSTFGGSIRKQRRQISFVVRYCTNPHALQRITSRSISSRSLLPLLSDTGNPHTFFWLRKGGTDTGGKAETGARGIVPGDAIGVKNYFEECEVFAQISTTGRVETVVEVKCSWKLF